MLWLLSLLFATFALVPVWKGRIGTTKHSISRENEAARFWLRVMMNAGFAIGFAVLALQRA